MKNIIMIIWHIIIHYTIIISTAKKERNSLALCMSQNTPKEERLVGYIPGVMSLILNQ